MNRYSFHSSGSFSFFQKEIRSLGISKQIFTVTGGMLALETKQSGGKLLHHLDLGGWGGSVSRGRITQQAKRDEYRDFEH